MTHRPAAPSWTAPASSSAPRSLIAKRSSTAIALAVCAALGGAAVAQVAPPRPGDAGSVLPGRPVAPQAVEPVAIPAAGVAATPTVALDPPYLSVAAGISVRPPAGGKVIRRGGGGDEVARFVNDEQKWRYVISRVTLTQAVPLVHRDAATTTAPTEIDLAARELGFAETIAAGMPKDVSGKLTRSELMPINGYDGAILASRYHDKDGTFLLQQAVIRRTDMHYYVLSYTTPVGDGELQRDAGAVHALDVFQGTLDSVEVIDQEQVKRDQDERLIRTRGMMVNWTRKRLSDAIVPEQWLRLIKDGKDVGYSYVVEELANDLPRVGGKTDKSADPAKALGVRVGVRSRTMPEAGQQVDGESWMWISFDRSQEAFSNVVINLTEPKAGEPGFGQPRPQPKDDPNYDYSVERGTSIRRDRIVPREVPSPTGIGTVFQGVKDEQYDLQIFSRAKRAALPQLQREVPPFYLPQALAHLLPRIVPLDQVKTYMFASYVTEQRAVMTRYVDVLAPASVDLGGRVYTAIPVKERLGLEGSVTTHYMTPDGKTYLGSVNEDNKITIVATDAQTLQRIWKDAQLQRPAEVDDAAAAATPGEAKPADAPKPADAKPADAPQRAFPRQPARQPAVR